MAELTAQEVATDGTELTTAATEATDTFANNGKMIVKLVNSDSSSHDVTLVAQTECNHGTLHDITITVPASSEVLAGTFEKARFNDSDTKLATIDYGGQEANFEVAVIEI